VGNKNRDKIDAYLAGHLSFAEIEELEEHVLHCEGCFEVLQLREMVVGILREKGEEVVKKKLKIRLAQPAGRLSKLAEQIRLLSWGTPPKWIYGTAGILMLVFLTFLLFNPFASETIFELSQIEPFPYLQPHTLGEVTESRRIFFEAMEHYQQKDFEKAGQKLEETLVLDPQFGEAQFYLGSAYLFQDKLNQAIENLKIAVENNRNSEKEHWFLGHAYLKNGNTESALSEFQVVANLGQERYADRAQELVGKIQDRRLRNK